MAKYLKRYGKRVEFEYNGSKQEVRIDTKNRTFILDENGKKKFVTIQKDKQGG